MNRLKRSECDWPMAADPDWEVIRRTYEGSSDVVDALAKRFGVSPGQITYRVERFEWRRPGAQPALMRSRRNEVEAFARQLRSSLTMIIQRDKKLMRQIEAEGNDLSKQLHQHKTSVSTVVMILKSVDGLYKMMNALAEKDSRDDAPSERDKQELKALIARCVAAGEN